MGSRCDPNGPAYHVAFGRQPTISAFGNKQELKGMGTFGKLHFDFVRALAGPCRFQTLFRNRQVILPQRLFCGTGRPGRR